MNAERLHAIALAVLGEITGTNIENTLQQLMKALQNQVNQPQTAQFQQQVSQLLQTLNTSLEKAPSKNFSPDWNQALTELGIRSLLGDELSNRIREIFQRNQITPSAALQEIQKIHGQLSASRTGLDQLSNSFKLLHIGAEELEPGQCEVGIVVPRSAVSNQLDEFSSDLSEINNIFGVFSELTTGHRPSFQIRSISSSDFSILMDMSPVTAASIAVAGGTIIKAYKDLLEIRKLNGELKEKGIPNKVINGISGYADKMMQDVINKLVPDLLKKYYKVNDENRRAELTTELHFALNKIARRVDKGYHLEIRVQVKSNEKQGTPKSKQASENAKHETTILSATADLQFVKLEGVPILTLPESQAKTKSKPKAKAKPKV